MSQAVADEIANQREPWLKELLRVVPLSEGALESETKQFLHGFLYLIEACARGDEGPRTDYLELVIPSVKASGMTLGYVMRALVVLQVQLGIMTAAENRDWHLKFAGDYAERVVEAWRVG